MGTLLLDLKAAVEFTYKVSECVAGFGQDTKTFRTVTNCMIDLRDALLRWEDPSPDVAITVLESMQRAKSAIIGLRYSNSVTAEDRVAINQFREELDVYLFKWRRHITQALSGVNLNGWVYYGDLPSVAPEPRPMPVVKESDIKW